MDHKKIYIVGLLHNLATQVMARQLPRHSKEAQKSAGQLCAMRSARGEGSVRGPNVPNVWIMKKKTIIHCNALGRNNSSSLLRKHAEQHKRTEEKGKRGVQGRICSDSGKQRFQQTNYKTRFVCSPKFYWVHSSSHWPGWWWIQNLQNLCCPKQNEQKWDLFSRTDLKKVEWAKVIF